MFKKIILILLVLIIALAIFVFLGLTGRSEFASDLLGMNEAKDLGVVYGAEDLASLRDKVDPMLGEEGYVPPQQTEMDGRIFVPVDTTITESEASAYLNESINRILPTESLQVSFGSVYLSGITNVDEIIRILNTAGITGSAIDRVSDLFEEGAPIPFYVHLDLKVENGAYDVTIHTARIGRISVPDSQLEQNRDRVNGLIASAMEELGFALDTFEAGDQEAHIRGLIDVTYLNVATD